MRRSLFTRIAIGLGGLLLSVCAGVRAQVSSPAQTIQGAKQQVNKATSGHQTAPASKQSAQPAKQQGTPSPAAKNQAPPVKSQAPAKQPPAKATATPPAPSKTQAKVPEKAPSKAPAAKAPAKAPAKAMTRAQGKAAPAGKPPAAKAAPAAAEAKAKPAAVPEEKVARRDPFATLLNKPRAGGAASTERLPPGKPGLVVATLRIQGIVRGPNGMIAVVANPQQSVYFLREGDQLYDGRVMHIDMNGVAFHETGKDAFGKPVDREVTKRLYPIAGEQP